MITAADLALRLGLQKYPHSWRGRCPACDYPGGVFSVREVKGRTRLYCANGCAPDDLNDAIARRFGSSWQPSERQGEQDDAAGRARNQGRALSLWAGSEPAPGTLADTYLTRRGSPRLAASPALRFRGDCPHPEERSKYPALVALVTDGAGCGFDALPHNDFRRNRIEPDRAAPDRAEAGLLRFCIRFAGAIAAQISAVDGHRRVDRGRLLGLPAWAAIAAGNLGQKLMLPLEVRRVVIATDSDIEGRKAAFGVDA